MLKITKLNAGYGVLKVIKDLSLELERGTVSVLMGPNGAGKSTLLKAIFNICDVTGGKIEYLSPPLIRGGVPRRVGGRGVTAINEYHRTPNL